MSGYRLEEQRRLEQELTQIQRYKLAKLQQQDRTEKQINQYRLRRNAEIQEAQYNIRRDTEIRCAEALRLRERLQREERQRQYELQIQIQRRSQLELDHEAAVHSRYLQQDSRRKTEMLAASRRLQLERQLKVKESIQKQTVALLSEQKQQQQLQAELKAIDLEIGTIYDIRDQQKQLQIQQLEQLDQESFKTKQKLRACKVTIKALEESIDNLTKIIL